MQKTAKKSVFSAKLLILIFGIWAANLSYSAPVISNQVIKNALPGSTEPGVISNQYANPITKNPTAQPSIKPPPEEVSSLGPEAAEIKFTLKQIVLDGNQVYSNHEIAALYKNKLNKEISVAELQGIVQDITNFYRNHGYILTRAVLPAQHVEGGVVHVKIIEGYIDQVTVVGLPKGARKMLEAYGARIAQSRPLKLSVMEHYLRLANEIPGLEVKAVLEPSKTQTGASDLSLSAVQSTLAGSFSYDNYGTLYLGPNQDTLYGAMNSIFLSGDSTRLTYLTTTRPQELKFLDISYRNYLSSNGLDMIVGGNNSKTQPGLNLATVDINGNSETYYTLFEYPMLRSRSKNLTLDAGANYLDSEVTTFNSLLYNDHLRSIKIGGSYDFAGWFNSSNLINLHLEQGLNLAGASNSPNSLTTSRYGATGIYTKINLQTVRLQPIYGRYALFFLLNGQYSYDPLLAAAQIGYGGSQLGRAYDPAEIIGDRGFGGTVELRVDFSPGKFLLQSLEPYVFYDAGVIWNIKNVIGVQKKQSIASTGFGTRFIFTPNFSGNLMFAQPLTKSIAAEEVVGRGKKPRTFFSIVASV
jgi:hemolysin activation/secretion protein